MSVYYPKTHMLAEGSAESFSPDNDEKPLSPPKRFEISHSAIRGVAQEARNERLFLEQMDRVVEDPDTVLESGIANQEAETEPSQAGALEAGEDDNVLPMEKEKVFQKLKEIGEEIEGRSGPGVNAVLYKGENKLVFDFPRTAGVSCAFSYEARGREAWVRVEYRQKGGLTTVLPEIRSWNIQEFERALNQRLDKVQERKDVLRMVDDPAAYARIKSREVLVIYRSGKRGEALEVAKKLGLEHVRDAASTDGLILRWSPEKPITKETLDALKAARGSLRIVQPVLPVKFGG